LFSRDLKLEKHKDLPDVFTTYRKMMEPLREKPRAPLPKPSESSLPSLPPASAIPSQSKPFEIPTTYDELEQALVNPVKQIVPDLPPFPEGAATAHPFLGGETHALARLDDIIKNGTIYNYKSSRNGLLGTEFSTKLSAYLTLGGITGRQIHDALVRYEDGQEEAFAGAEGYGGGENEGTKAVRFELLWRDYMRLCSKKFTYRLFRLSGFRDDHNPKWKTARKEDSKEDQEQTPDEIDNILKRVFAGTTGMGLIDASQRELIHTGYTSNRARQNVASFISKHLGIDWRYGAEWYEMLLVDYDVSSNWSNWQYVSGVGNDPRGEARIFNPVKQAFDYDKEGKYVKAWVPELRSIEKLENVFQVSTTPKEDWDQFGLTGLLMAEHPIHKIEFNVDGKPNKHTKRPFDRRRKDGRIRSDANLTVKPQDANGLQPENRNNNPMGGQGQQQQFSMFNPPKSPRGEFRGGRGGRGGGYRGRGYGGPRGGYRGGFQGQNQGYNYSQSPMAWSQSQYQPGP
jgi:deoxyribodipyrimidine photo-lyase